MAAITAILLPTGFSDLSRRAAGHARLLAQSHGAVVHVLHIVPPPVPSEVPGSGVPHMPPIAMPSDMLDAAKESVQRFASEQLPGLHPAPVTAVAIGPIEAEIVAYAQKHAIDLIVMGTHADGILKRLIFGSVSKSVLEHSLCPVLLVPVKDAKR